MLFGVSLIAIIIIFVGIKDEMKVNRALEFTKENVVATWSYDNDKKIHNYDFIMSKDDIDTISYELSNGHLKRGSVKEMPKNNTKEITILLNGKKIENEDSTNYSYENKFYIKNIDDKNAYIYLEINDISDDESTMKRVLERHYTIESKNLVNTINNLYK